MSIFRNLSSRRSDLPKAEEPAPPAAAPSVSPAAPGPVSGPASASPMTDRARSFGTASTRSMFAADDADASGAADTAAPRPLQRDVTGGSMWDIPNDSAPAAPAAPSAPPATPASWAGSAAEAFAAPRPAAPPFAEPGAGSGEPEPMARRSGRVKTRLLGIDHSNGSLEEIGARTAAKGIRFPVGWLVVIDGPGRGHSFPLEPGVSQIGRGEDQTVPLDFGDSAISRQGHAIIAFDDESRNFYLGHGGKSNLVRLNGKPVLSTETMQHGDRVRIGETTLMLVALCGGSFTWTDGRGD